jgi:sulfur carrier protein ThiS
MTKISVKLFATLRKYADGAASLDVEIEPGETIEQILKRRGVPVEQVRVVFVNGRASGLSHSLQGDERVELFSAIGGG